MKIYCHRCKSYILNSTDQFVLGGPYNGTMFESALKGTWRGVMFKQHANVRNAQLTCPRCENPFVKNGYLLTEHGVVRPLQSTIDRSFYVTAPDGHPLPGSILSVELSKEIPPTDRVKDLIEKQQQIIDSLDQQGENNEDRAKTEEVADDTMLKCPKCGKEYKGRIWFSRHLKECGK
jgi:uncharacterized C2H2 Zn-finger protein